MLCFDNMLLMQNYENGLLQQKLQLFQTLFMSLFVSKLIHKFLQ